MTSLHPMGVLAAPPAPAASPDAPVDDPVRLAQLDRATTWLFWALLRHRDGRTFAARIGEYRAFDTTWIRVWVPTGPTAGHYVLNIAAAEDWHLCSESHARFAASIIDHASFVDDFGGPSRGNHG